ncbi:MAG: L-seryl-tRNA(Sec) selenium transferase [Nitrospinota bacterium]
MTKDKQTFLSKIPSVDELLQNPITQKWDGSYPHSLVLDAIRSILDRKREAILKNNDLKEASITLSPDDILSEVETELINLSKLNLHSLINATGIIIHTNLGRSLLSDAAIKNVQDVAENYTNLEFDVWEGRRGKRYSHVEEVLCRLTGGEAATVVNNNAAAVMLVLNTLALGKEVIVSRGELIEIGGSFRIPDVMERSGARLREVGATNKTHLKDYRDAINSDTAVLLKVHTSNYKILGFTEEVSLNDLVELGKERGIPVIQDLGSGCFVDLKRYGIDDESTVQDSLRSGVDIVTFSGDKLLGGPQGGIIIGKKSYLDRIRENPLARAVRIDKMTLAGLEVTLREYFDEEKAIRNIPTLRMLCQTLEEIEERAGRIVEGLQDIINEEVLDIRIKDGVSRSGGGALPLGNLRTKVLAITPKEIKITEFEKGLRENDPPVIVRIKDEEILLDPRTILDKDIEIIIEAVKRVVKR